jgi:lysine-ketoglutarate reductase/saccharopine dehydrogenase-like protein (TIGR00300 family)
MRHLRERHRQGQADAKVLLAGGPAIVHAGGRDALTWLIEQEFIHVLFCGNALAAHDLEADLYGTSLGYGLTAGRAVPHGHDHHLRTINRIRAIGSIEAAVRSGMVKQGIMAACIRRTVPVVMAGTIRDDGPLPGVITDSIQAQQAMRALIPSIGLALLVASTLHSIATGNLLPATIPTLCVDLNPSVPTKLADRGSFQAAGLVMDAASFLSELAGTLGRRS